MPLQSDDEAPAATLKDVAAALGLSPSTVSRALAGHSHVGDATRTSVLRTAREMGYQPNAIARALRRRSTHTIGLIVPSIVNDFFAHNATAVQRAAEQSGYQVILCVTGDDPRRERQYLETLAAHNVAGVIMTPCADGAADALGVRIPIIELARQSNGRHYDAVLEADREGGEELTRYLIELGHERIAVIAGITDFTQGRDRLAGYRSAMESAGLSVPDDYVQARPAGMTSLDWARMSATELLALPNRPTAIVATGAQLTLGVFRALQEADFSCPEDISVAAFEDPPWYSVWNPSITAYSTSTNGPGYLAWQLLRRRISGEVTEEGHVSVSRLSGVLRIRRSAREYR